MLGLIAGLVTYGRPIKTKRGDGVADDIMNIGMGLSHMLIGYIVELFRGGRQGGTWLNDQQILAMLRGMSPSEFEAYIADMFTALGYRTKLVGGSGDGGIDIAMTKDGHRYLVQCKKFITQKVTPHDIRDFFGAMGGQHIDGRGFFVTTNIFTSAAEREAEGKQIELIHGNELIRMIRDSGILGKPPDTQMHISTAQIELCPMCGSSLVVRTNNNTGNNFIGCSQFPKCNFTKPV